MNTLVNGLITAVTGTDPTSLAAEASAAEQNIILAVEVIIALLFMVVLELAVMLRRTNK